jgi:hypothetical protein
MGCAIRPTFPAMFLGARRAVSHCPTCPGLPLVAGVAMGIGAMSMVMLTLPLTSVLLATLLLASDGLAVMPLVIVAVVVAHVAAAHLAPRPATQPAESSKRAAVLTLIVPREREAAPADQARPAGAGGGEEEGGR